MYARLIIISFYCSPSNLHKIFMDVILGTDVVDMNKVDELLAVILLLSMGFLIAQTV